MVTRKAVVVMICGLLCPAALGAEGISTLLEKEFREHLYSDDFSRISEKTPVELIRALADIDSLCYGENPDFEPDFEEVDRRTEALLRQYPSGEDRGLIFFRLARSLIQGIFKRPDMTIKYAQEALECPIGPAKKMQMYIDWGCAIQIQYGLPHRQDWPAVKRDILMKYLQVLKLGLDYGLPEERQEFPTVGRSVTRDGPDNEYLQEMRRTNADQMQARNLVMYANSMIQSSASAVDCVGWLYYFPPLDVNELRRLAMEVLGDENLVDRLVAAANKNIAVRVKHETGLAVETAVDEIIEASADEVLGAPEGEGAPPADEAAPSVPPRDRAESQTQGAPAAPQSRPHRRILPYVGALAAVILIVSIVILRMKRSSRRTG